MTSIRKHQQTVDSDSSDAPEKAPNSTVSDNIISSVETVPVTVERQPFHSLESKSKLKEHGTPRVNIAATPAKPTGTTEDNYAARHRHQTVLQQHCEFFDPDRDGIIWPINTFNSMRKLGFGWLLSIFSVLVIHGGFSYPTLSTILPDPFFRIHLANIHKDKHGSDSGTYDTEGRFIPQKFEDMFAKYGDGDKSSLDIWQISRLMKGNRLVMDPFGWSGAAFEWIALYLMIWPEDGKIYKEDIRKLYDGSLFYDIAARREKNEPASRGDFQRAKRRQV